MNIHHYLTYFSARWQPIDPLTPRGLNPQPLPPKEAAVGFAAFDPLAARALNPQPLPPKELAFSFRDPLGPVSLNPQPLPPKFSTAALLSRTALY